jgi:hypothetical protein
MSNFYSNCFNLLDLFSKNDSCASSPSKWRKSNITNMGFALLLVSFLLSTGFGFAQNISNYAFATANNGSLEDISAGNTTYLVGVNDDTAGTVQALGFDFLFMGNKYTHFSANSNGQMRLHASSGEAAIGTNVSTALNGAIFAPFTGDNEVGNGMRFKMIGTAPNRTFVVEWNQFYINYQNLTNAGNMQVWLEETTGKVTYMYGEIFNSATSAQTRSILIASSNTATTVGSVTIGVVPLFTVGTTLVTNSIAAGANPIGSPLIVNIGSASNGNRTYFTFTPPSTVSGDINNLAFTAIVANGATLNWDDNATNEAGFVITRATDAAFTQNIASFTVPSTTSGTTGMSYSFVQTGLGAGTTFYYKVVAIVEAGQSTGVTGNVSTLVGATYYWTGATGGNWNTFANWNMAADGTGTVPLAWDNSDVYVIDGEGTTSGGTLSIVVDRTSFTIGQIRVIGNTNLTLASSATTTRTITILGGPNEDFLLEAGSSLNLTSATNAIAFVFAGSGNTGIIGGTYIASGSTSNVINSTGGSGTLVVVASTGSVISSMNSSSATLVGSMPTLRFENGSNYNHAASTTVNYIPTATWLPMSTVTLNGNTTGTGMTSNSTSLGNLVINTTLSTATFSAFTSNSRVIQGNLIINNTGTGKFRAVTSGLLQVNGNLIINGGVFEVGSSAGGGVIVKGNTTVASGAILDLNRSTLQNEGNMLNNGSVLSSETTTTNSSLNFLGTTSAQTLSGAGTFTGRVSSLGVLNPLGLTISTPVLIQRVNLFSGTIAGSSNITIGTGLSLAGAVQIGSATNTTSGGNFDAAPIFNLGTGVYTLLYLGETTARTMGLEVPASRSVTNLIVDNANGLTINGGTIEVVNALTLTNGIITSTLANHILHGSATAAGILTGGSITSYISGPLVRTIADTNTAFVLFPVGKAQYAPVSLAPTTTEVTLMKAETFDSNAGTANASIINLSVNRRWQTALVSGAFTDIKVILADALLVSTNIPVQAPSAAGAYTTAFGSTATFTAGTPNVIESNTAVTAANFTGFLSFADSNACTGTPTPGNTIASANAICLGSSVTLSLQNSAAGSGITYQWKSSTDGVNYTDIASATGATLSVTQMVETFYLCDVTCLTGPTTATSAAIQITFSNNIASTTAAARCGVGTVTLAATSSAGATINWYAAATGGLVLASGPTFETPSISANTIYYAAAEVASPLGGILGAGGTISTSAGGTFLPGFWGGAKTQYIIKANELTAAGLSAGAITNIGFEATTSGQIYQGFVVEMGTTTQTEANTTFISGLTQVYRGTLADDGFTPIANAVNTLLFGAGSGSASAFTWDGTSNIVISIAWSRVPSASTAAVSGMKADNVGFNSTAWRQRDNLTPAAMLAETSASAVGANRPRFIINNTTICSSPRVAVTATVSVPPVFTLSTGEVFICSGSASNAVTATAGAADYDTYVWSPATGVSGNSTTGWVFNTTMSGTYTLTASQSAGNLCAVTAMVIVTANPIPSALTFTTTPAPVCTESIIPISVTGGTLSNVAILSENFNALTNNWTTVNSSTGGTPANVAWTLTNSPFDYGFYGTFSSNDASRFYLSNNDAGGSGSSANTELISPSFSTINYVSANLSFWHYFRSAGNAKVEYSIDNGTVWTTIQTFTTTTGAIGAFVQQNIVLPVAALNQANVQVRFKYDTTGWEYFWALDNVTISGSLSTSITWSPVTNLFTDAAATVPYTTGTGAATVYVKSATSGVTNYTATATSSLGCTTSEVLTVAINATPTVVTVNPAAGCSPATVDLTAAAVAVGSDAGLTFTYFTDAAATVALANPNAVSGSGTYFIKGTNTNGCSAVAAVVVTINAAPTVVTVNPAAGCSPATVDLTAAAVTVGSDTGLTFTYFTDAAATIALTTPNAVSASGTYYIKGMNTNGCSAVAAVAVVVNITASPIVLASSQTFCNAATVADLMAIGTTLQWYADATGGSALASTTVLATGNYYVSQTLNSCESARTMVDVTVTAVSAPTGVALQDFIAGQTLADFTVSGTNIVWYTAATGGTVLPSTTVLVSGTIYYASQTIGTCESETRLAVTAGVDLRTSEFEIANLRYYPNPVQNILTIDYSQTIEDVQMFNMLGQLVYNRNTNTSKVLIEMTNMAAGNYILQVTINGITKNMKVIKK